MPTNSDVFDILAQAKRCTVFIGRPSDGTHPNWLATGCLVEVGQACHLVTAKHVVVDVVSGERTDGGLFAFYNLVGGRVAGRRIAQVKDQGFDWVFHEDPSVDLAAIPLPIKLGQDDVFMVPDTRFAPLATLEETWDLIYVAYQPGAERPGRVSPVLRTGMLSRKDEDGSFLIDGAAFPGNSGCPVFVKPTGTRLLRAGVRMGGDPEAFQLAGIIGAYIPYMEEAVSRQTGLTRILFQENTGLSRVWSSDRLRELIDSKPFRDQVAKAPEYKEDPAPGPNPFSSVIDE